MSAQKAKGTKWESRIVDYLRANGYPHAERRTLNGTADRGDINAAPGLVIEAKNQARHSFAEWLDEANAEAFNDRADVGLVWAHRRGKASAGDGFVVMDGVTAVRLLRMAGFGDELDTDTEEAS